jgi:outer membrane protein assembly factor BamD
MFKPARILLPLLAAGLVLSGCASTKAKKDRAYIAMDVETLYNAARDTMINRQYKLAAAQFDEVERQHPYSVWARRAQLMSAYSYFVGRSYNEAIQSAQRFLSLHPGSREAPYAYYIVAVSYYNQISDVEHDQKITQQALDALGELIRRYPNTDYAADAKLKIDLTRDHLAGKEMEIGRFYQNSRQYLAAVLRFRTVVEKYDTTSHIPEALHRLIECYLSLGIPEEAKKTAAVLGYNYPGSKWYDRSYALIGKKAVPEPAPKPVAAAKAS